MTRPNMSIKVGRKPHDMRILGRIVGVRSTEQSVLSLLTLESFYGVKTDIMKNFLEYLNECTNPYAVVDVSSEILRQEGFTELSLKEEWKLEEKTGYFIPVYGTTLMAFYVNKLPENNRLLNRFPFHMVCAHTDHPCLRIKPNPEMKESGYLKLDTECYGGLIISTWLDRPLSIGGRVVVRGEQVYEPKAVNFNIKRPVLTIPNLAIHMNRDVNKGFEYNKQTQLLPIAGLALEKSGESEEISDEWFLDFLSAELSVKKEEILDFDIYVYNAEEACRMGINNEFISSPRLDNLTSCYAALCGIIDVADSGFLNIISLFDNEEIGSRTKQGADSSLQKYIIDKIYRALGVKEGLTAENLFDSMILSADVAHAHHPNFSEKSDPKNKCVCGKGTCIKLNYSQKYATDSLAVGALMQLCEKNNIPVQKFVNRSDIAGGSTIGTIISSAFPVMTVDIGVPLLAMHSARELMAVSDEENITAIIKSFL